MNSATTDVRIDPKVPDSLAGHGFLSVEEAARRMKRSKRTLRRWGREGLLPSSVRLGRDVFVKESDLDALLEPAWNDGLPSSSSAA
ncbi:MAG: helix-turn-helix domain-containing protein [Polyangiaceae bacterium]|nr:helix-turn-helix domain-containing protein [Polyangiaceae bacterium]